MLSTLIVVNFQNAYIDACKKSYPEVEENIKNLINEYYYNDYEVIFINKISFEDETWRPGRESSNMPEYINTDDCEIIYNEALGHPYWDIVKDDVHEVVNPRRLGDVEIIGYNLDTELLANALIIKSLYPKNKVRVNLSCCASINNIDKLEIISILKRCDIDVIEKYYIDDEEVSE